MTPPDQVVLGDGCVRRGTDPAPGLAIAVRSLEPNRAAIPRGQHRPTPSPGPAVLGEGSPGGQHRLLPGPAASGVSRGPTKTPANPAILGGSPRRIHGPHRRRGSPGKDRKKSRGREAVLGEMPPSCPHSPTQEGPGWGATPSPGVPAALGLQPAALGRRPDRGTADPGSRPAIGTHRHGHLGRHYRSPDGQRRRHAGGFWPPRRSEPKAPGPGALGGPRRLLRAPGGRTVRPLKPALRMRRPRGPSPLPSPPRGQR